MYQNVSVPYCPFYRPFQDQISAHVIKRFTNNATGLIPPLSLCREAGGNRCSCRDAHPFPLLRDQPRKPVHPLVFPPQGCLSSFATHDRIASAQVPLCEQAQCSWASGRAWDGCPRPLSPRPGKCLLPCKLDRRPGSCLLVDGHWRWWPDLRAPSLVCFEYSRRFRRSHPLSGGLSLPLLLPAVPQRRRAPLQAAVNRTAAR